MIKIFKYTLDKLIPYVQPIEMPINAKIISMKNQCEEIVLWAEVNAVNALEIRSFVVLATGDTKLDDPLKYHATLQFLEGNYVVHIYELIGDN